MLGFTTAINRKIANLEIPFLSYGLKIKDAKTNDNIAVFDSFLGYDYLGENKTVERPVENGSFSSYNKITMPYQINVRLSKMGYPIELRELVDTLEKYKNSTNLVNIILPYKSYINVSLNKLSHGIKEGGAISMLICELGFSEIRKEYATYQNLVFVPSKLKNASNSSTQDVGLKMATVYTGTV